MIHVSHIKEKYKLCVRIQKYREIKIFEIHCPLVCLIPRWISKIFISWYCWLLIWNLHFLTKTEWKKCPISDILDKLIKIFKIRQVYVSLCDNKPYRNYASKVVFYDAYHQYKLCFQVTFSICTNLRQNVSSLLYNKKTKKSLFQYGASEKNFACRK